MIRHMRHGSPPRLMALQSILSPNRRESLPTPSGGVRMNPLGLYDIDRNIRAVGRAYKKLIHDWRAVLPTQSVCLTVPLVGPNEHGEEWAVRRADGMRRQRAAPPSEAKSEDQADY